MYLFFETISIENGQAKNLEYHQKRLDQTQINHWKNYKKINLKNVINLPIEFQSAWLKFRVFYAQDLLKTDYQLYTPLEVKSLFVIDSELDYTYKSTNRKELDALRQQAKKYADEVLIAKNGFITDTSYSNVAFFDGKQWFTPTTYLLNGTQRQFLLDQKILLETDIRTSDVHKFQKILLYNSMLGFEENRAFGTEKIFWS